jgi:hypothetical protein
MPRRRWLIKARREPLSPAMRVYLELGQGGLYAANQRAPLDGYGAARFFDGEHVRAARWREHGAEITATWVLEHAGTRPWGCCISSLARPAAASSARSCSCPRSRRPIGNLCGASILACRRSDRAGPTAITACPPWNPRPHTSSGSRCWAPMSRPAFPLTPSCRKPWIPSFSPRKSSSDLSRPGLIDAPSH